MTGRPRTLPDDWELRRLRSTGMSDTAIARNYGVTPQAVSKRFRLMGQQSRPIRFREILPWPIARTHHSLYAAQRLKDHIKARHGEELPERRRRLLAVWHERLQREGVVLAYVPEELENPWIYVPRVESDGRLVVRWPAGAEPPTLYQRGLLEMPGPPFGTG